MRGTGSYAEQEPGPSRVALPPVMNRALFLTSAAGVLCAAGSRAAVADGARPGPFCLPLAKGAAETVYDFELYLLDGEGKTFRLGDMLGSPVWLNFFASWCPPCNKEAGRIIELSKRYAPQGLHVIGIDVNEKPAAVRGFRDEHKIDYPIALDETGSVFTGLGLHEYPTHMFLHRTGKISCIFAGNLETSLMDNEVAVIVGDPKPI
jgi:thiol-disulfide isomerase/thioredoxin